MVTGLMRPPETAAGVLYDCVWKHAWPLEILENPE
jgi:hypothetical protein